MSKMITSKLMVMFDKMSSSKTEFILTNICFSSTRKLSRKSIRNETSSESSVSNIMARQEVDVRSDANFVASDVIRVSCLTFSKIKVLLQRSKSM